MADKTASSNALGYDSGLLMIFIVLKLTHLITWSWWWVLSPIWIIFSVLFLFALVQTIMEALIMTVEDMREE